MNRFQTALSTVALLVAGLSGAGCTPGGVGDPCTPEDEYGLKFPGYAVEEVNVEAMSFQCETRLCLVNHFQGRVSCPYGQQPVVDASGAVTPVPLTGNPCYIPDGSKTNVVDPSVEVKPQLLGRKAKDAVYCSCRCAGPDKNARYCQCPSGYACTLLNEIPLGADQLLGSYCVRNGTAYDATKANGTTCRPTDPSTQCPSEGCADKALNAGGPACTL